jgi:hypothetical protein
MDVVVRRAVMLHCFAHCCRSGGPRRQGVWFGAAIRGVQIVRLHIEKHGHDPRQVDLVTVIILVFGAICYLCCSEAEPMTAGFIVPIQTVHW